ncbi:uncharacterized protein LOC116408816 [Xenopus tropicalis]|uniref:Uncharacterized LOC116408816 n=1 Tax=Xenopus tropicalis TaxID=8364 RepID=A0A6I8R5K2_XENTR|nr:uncharacterized protein LOC116408816 [Xenopus tropicalis]
MPYCIVKGCPHRTGQKLKYPDVVLHPFPRDIHLIKKWLMQTGQHNQGIDTLSERIFQGTKNNAFRMCSTHFTPDSYMMRGSRRLLSPKAVPTVFASIPTPAIINVPLETTLPSQKRRRVDDEEASTSTRLVRIVSHLITVATQTESYTKTCSTMTSRRVFSRQATMQTTGNGGKVVSTQTEDIYQADVMQVRKDHTVCFYSDLLSASPISPALQSLENPETPLKGRGSLIKHPSSIFSSPTVAEPRDTTFEISEPSSSENSKEEQETTESGQSKYLRARKFIIFEDNLDALLHLVRCQHAVKPPCQAPIVEIKKSTDGSLLKVQLCCINGHTSLKWFSQPVVDETSIGNVALANAIILSGSTYRKVRDMFTILNVPFYSHTSFYCYQRKFVYPAIDIQWKKEQAAIKESLSGQSVTLAGDGQYDSPRHAAKYCTYSMMDLMSKKIVHFEIDQVGPGKNANKLEPLNFEKALNWLIHENFDVKIVATDRHSVIKNIMSSKFENIDHQFDVWHLCKSIHKKLLAASKKRNCSDIASWITPITNHLWWSSQTCKQNVNVLIDKWKSLLFHIANKHTFKSLQYYQKCQHQRLTAAQKKHTRWIGSNHPAYNSLKLIVNDTLRDIRKIEKFCHTSDLENFHSKVLKYKPKRLSFKMDGMIARTALGALSHNRNVHRQQAVVTSAKKSTLPVGKKRFKIVFPKQKEQWVAKPMYEEVLDEHLFEIMSDSIKILTGEISHEWLSMSQRMPKNIATYERPEKTEVIDQHSSCFARP